jgi:hypothetical protein
MFGQIGSSIGLHSMGKKSRLPLLIIVIPCGSFITLPFLKLCFQFCRFIELFALDGLGDSRPEAL